MRIVVAVGGNALARRGEPMDLDVQRWRVAEAAHALAPIFADHEVVLTHGNGPQVGLLALQADAYPDVAPYPLDVLGAETEGMIGYLLEQALGNALPDKRFATLLTEVIVDAADPAYRRPTKPIGPVYTATDASRIAEARGWSMVADGQGFRRVVPSPEPLAIVQLEGIRALIAAGIVPIALGGGGVPTVLDITGVRQGAEAVVDKDLAAALLARELDADMLLLLTDVVAVYSQWGTSRQQEFRSVTTDRLRGEDFSQGSMGPKVEAACRFADATGRAAAIGALMDAAR
ncbi:MAG TPA: carbamate kinase, partial [Candidatus Dormibacteraeota bacterium]|nr:carbamate kinase [Candidatus Dormibacteraeota bacterium]